jgi:hypothetical protein
MSLLKSAARILLLAVTGLLSSCIDSREEFWLEADGSGHAEITCSLPASAARAQGGETGIREMIAAFLKNTPEITRSSHEVATEGDRTHVKIRVSFDSALDLMNAASGPAIKKLPSAASHLAGDVSAKFRGRTLELTRTVFPGKALPGAAFLPASRFEGYKFVTRLHLPAAATESNATRVENGGRTLVWETPLATAVHTPPTTRFKMDIPIPWKLVTAISLPLSLIGGLAFYRLRKSLARRKTAS